MFSLNAAHTGSRKLASLAATATLIVSGALVASAPVASAVTPAEATASNSVLAMMNAERGANHLPALAWSAALISSAHRHNLVMAAANTLSHQLPREPDLGTRISQAGVNWHQAAENIGWSSQRSPVGAASLQTAMYNEKAPNDGHRVNILSSGLRYVGVDTYMDPATGKLWLTEDFADATGPAAAAPAPVPAPAPAPAPASKLHNPIGHFDSVTVLPGGRVRMLGWAMDPDSKATPLYIAMFIDGRFGGYVRAPVPRPDVTRAKGAGPYQGFSIIITLPRGRHAISTYAVNVSAGSGESFLGAHLCYI